VCDLLVRVAAVACLRAVDDVPADGVDGDIVREIGRIEIRPYPILERPWEGVCDSRIRYRYCLTYLVANDSPAIGRLLYCGAVRES